MTNLSEPRESTVRKLFALSSNRCAFPGCSTAIVDVQSGTIIGEISHIRGHKPNSPRDDASQTAEERHALENLILMCGVHHKIIDARENLDTYTVQRLQAMKADHERAAKASETLPLLTDHAVRELLD